MKEQITATLAALAENNMQPYYCATKAEALAQVKALLKPGQSIGLGGSQSLKQTGVLELVARPEYRLQNRYAPGLTRAQALDVMRQSFLADVFICSANAITQQGELYNVDGNGNRVSAMIFGPKSVIVVAGVNKIVPDLSAAVQRVKAVAAPQNAKRLGCQTPCAKTGQCLALQQGKTGLCSGCSAPQRICSSYTVLGWQQQKGRIKVILCGEELGY